MDWILKLIEKHTKDGQLDQEALMKDINKEFPKYAVPKDKYNEVSEARKQLETDIAERDKQLRDLGGKAKGNEDLEKQIKELQETNAKAKEDYETKINNLTLDNAIKLTLKDNKAKYQDLLMSKFDREKLSIKEDGSIEGLEEQMKSIKEGYKDLFEQPISGQTPNQTGESDGPSDPFLQGFNSEI